MAGPFSGWFLPSFPSSSPGQASGHTSPAGIFPECQWDYPLTRLVCGSSQPLLPHCLPPPQPVLMLLRSCQPPPGASLPPHPRRVISVSSSPPATQEFEDGVFTFAHDCQRDGGQARSPPTLLQPHSVSKVHKWCSSEGEGPGGRKGTRATSCSAAHGESSRPWLSLAIRPQASALQAALRPPPTPTPVHRRLPACLLPPMVTFVTAESSF